MNSSTAKKVTIRETGPTSNDRHVVPIVVASAASVRTCLADPQGADANRSRDGAAGATRTATARRGCSSRGDAATADHPHPPRCPEAPTLLGELAATTDPNLSWIQRRSSAHEVSCPPASSFVAVYGQDLVAAVSFPGCEPVAANEKLQSEQLPTFNGLFRLPL